MSTLDIHQTLLNASHVSPLCTFSTHDLANVFKGITLYQPKIPKKHLSILLTTDVEELFKNEQPFVHKRFVEAFLLQETPTPGKFLNSSGIFYKAIFEWFVKTKGN